MAGAGAGSARGMFFSRNPTQGACPADNHPHDCGAIGRITGEDRSGGDIRAHRDLRSVPGAADLIEIKGGGKVPLSVDLRFQIGPSAPQWQWRRRQR